ncbi:alginate lyase family protein, partial [Inquilinus limosus]|uniref:alginate lyase family protein n=1 Tax=Inquilinus limosus TaxID=171674 RepID=UPI00068BEE92
VRGYYGDHAHSVIDPARKQAYDAAVAPLHDALAQVEAMVDRYRRTGDPAAARCAAQWLDRFARDGVLLGEVRGNQSVYVQGWMLGGLAVSWLKLRGDRDPADIDSRHRIKNWFSALADRNLAYYSPGRATRTDTRNNHRYWAGFAVAAAGIATGRAELLDWGIASYRLGAAQVDEDGMLPLEAARQGRALHYHLFAAAPLVMIAELAAVNGVDLYPEANGALGRLVERALSGLQDPRRFAERAGAPQEDPGRETWAWVVPYLHRVPQARAELPAGADLSRGTLYLGGLPPD